MKFHEYKISDEILKALDVLGYKEATKIQEAVIENILNNVDVIAKAQTGSGKTAAFAIPLCEKVNSEQKEPQVLILTPTRELAIQVKDEISNIGRLKKLRTVALYGKQPMSIQTRELRQRVHFIVGTPGRTIDHINRGNLKLTNIKYLVLDEADEMLNMGFIGQVEEIIEMLPKDRVTLLFSATMPDRINKLCRKYMKNPKEIEVDSENLTVSKIMQGYYEVKEFEKGALLQKIIYSEVPGSTIIFCNTKEKVDEVYKQMKKMGISCEKLHGGLEQRDRTETMEKFKLGEFQFLIATDVAARGIHIEDITHVINYDVPMEKEAYVHRIGRTGRAGKEGKAFTFITPFEYKFFNAIENYIGEKISENEEPSSTSVREGEIIFREKMKKAPKKKEVKSKRLNKEVSKIYIGAGKKKKVRAGDIVGAICNIEGVTVEDIGIIDVQDNVSYVDILNGKGKIVLNNLGKCKIKGKTVKIEMAKR